MVARATNNIPYGWLECNGQTVLRADYPELFEYFNTQKYDGTHTLLSRYGSTNSSNFKLPDYREVALVGIGSNGTDSIPTHDAYTLGLFKDDCIQGHYHNFTMPTLGKYASIVNPGQVYADDTTGTFSTTDVKGARADVVTRGKRKGVMYLIKVL